MRLMVYSNVLQPVKQEDQLPLKKDRFNADCQFIRCMDGNNPMEKYTHWSAAFPSIRLNTLTDDAFSYTSVARACIFAIATSDVGLAVTVYEQFHKRKKHYFDVELFTTFEIILIGNVGQLVKNRKGLVFNCGQLNYVIEKYGKKSPSMGNFLS